MKQLIFIMSAGRIFRVQIGNAIAKDATLQFRIFCQTIVFHPPRIEQPLQISAHRIFVAFYRFSGSCFVGLPPNLTTGIDIGGIVEVWLIIAEPVDQGWSWEAFYFSDGHLVYL